MRLLLVSLISLAALAACTTDVEPPPAVPAFIQASTPEQAGHYFFLMGGCNDCHTPGWAESNGKLPEAEWAVGNPVGYRGSWGTTYAENLRLSAMEHTEKQWVQLFRQSAGLPPMPWENYRSLAEVDLIAVQRFLRSLGPRGTHALDPLPPGKEPSTPYVDFTPRTPTGSGR